MGKLTPQQQANQAGQGKEASPPVRLEDLARSRLIEWTPAFAPRTRERHLAPLSQVEVEHHAKSIGVSTAGIEYVISAIVDPPARKVRNSYGTNRVGERHGYVQGSFLPEKSEARIQTESDGEMGFAEIVSCNPLTLILLDQPTTVTVTYVDSIGRRQPRRYTPDYLLVMSDRVVAVEVKPLQTLLGNHRSRPDIWSFRDGRFSFCPAENHFRSVGIDYEVVPTETIPWILARNLSLLEAVPYPLTDEEHAKIRSVQRAVHRKQPASIEAVMSDCSLPSGVPILQAILLQKVYVDLSRCCLWHPESATICSTLERATKIGLGIEQRDLILQRGHGDSEQQFNPRYLERIGFRFAVINGQAHALFPESTGISERTVQRWRARYREHGLAGLAPKSENAGRPRSITDANLNIAMDQIASDRSSGNGVTIEKSYARYCVTAESMSAGANPIHQMSKASYNRLWHLRDHNRIDAQKAKGKRAANADAGRVATEKQAPLATVPFQVAQVDHCTLPVACEMKGDAILSMLVDQVTEEVLAWIVLFSPPSSTTDALLIRDCVRRHGRLPRTIYSDGGSDFRGNAFQMSLWDLQISFLQRASGHPKSGSQVERRHDLVQEAAIRGTTGFKEDVKSSRAVSASHSHEARRKQVRSRVLEKVSLCIDMINNGTAWQNAQSLIEMRLRFEKLYGKQGVAVEQDLSFFVTTSPFVDIGGRTSPRGAIRWDQRYFTSTILISKSITVARLSPRLDPESDGNVIYFYLDEAWHRAVCRAHALRAGISDELLAGTAPFAPRHSSERGIHLMHKAMEEEQRAYDEVSARTGSGPELTEPSRHREISDEQSPPTSTLSPCVDDGWDSVQPAPLDPAMDAS
ncbi:DDE-type integrase/transposase/recombinase [Stenotrophomonas maltophilia]|uniref:helix-turn-helix domain-containing protein n=1 Tax=Stenotrophomonas maltophilia TaxID=40324 RepID=UPI0021C88F8E|nr:helix-turn-helix domain-containing protein [Stenotrophomonas maltophilia]MCU1156861.1 DDE-type integrase/transposase/recombinase [Stenotrophomonas maltophilia]